MAAYHPPDPDFYTAEQVAVLLGVHPVTVRRWRTRNKTSGSLRHGPPYEYRGARVVYPKELFRHWCARIQVIDGVPRMNLPITASVQPPVGPDQQQTVIRDTEQADG